MWDVRRNDGHLPMLRLTHFSEVALTEIRSAKQSCESDMKPDGLWVSVDGPDDWPSWCESESSGLLRPVANVITLAGSSRILILKSPSDVFEFTRQYGVTPSWSNFKQSIAWPMVAEEYQGIIISPYQWACRHHPETFWYYGWDCASGCIWDHRAIESVHLKAVSPEGPAGPDATPKEKLTIAR